MSGSEKPTTFWQSIAGPLGNVVFALPNLKAMLGTADPLYWAFCHALNALLRVAEGVLPALTTFDGVLVKFSVQLTVGPVPGHIASENFPPLVSKISNSVASSPAAESTPKIATPASNNLLRVDFIRLALTTLTSHLGVHSGPGRLPSDSSLTAD